MVLPNQTSAAQGSLHGGGEWGMGGETWEQGCRSPQAFTSSGGIISPPDTGHLLCQEGRRDLSTYPPGGAVAGENLNHDTSTVTIGKNSDCLFKHLTRPNIMHQTIKFVLYLMIYETFFPGRSATS